MKSLSRRAIKVILQQARFARVETREACAVEAEGKKAQADQRCATRRRQEAGAKSERGEAYRDARGTFRRESAGCGDRGREAAARAKPGEKRAAGKAARASCRAAARSAEASSFRRYKGARAAHEQEREERRVTCRQARGARREAFDACDRVARQRLEDERRRAELLEDERRQAAKRARGGRRPPTSPGERGQEERGRVSADLAEYPDVARLFEQRSAWFLAQWAKARKANRRLTLTEYVLHYAHENPDAVIEAQERDTEEWLEREMKRWRRAG